VKFKIDENLPCELAVYLREAGHDAETVFDEGLSGAPDGRLMHIAHAEDRILMTLDKGVANLRKYPSGTSAGVVLFRPDRSGRKTVLAFIQERLSDILALDLLKRITVVTPSRIRTR
jgi:predicted nuclease of predicted toxin-antitoxin system